MNPLLFVHIPKTAGSSFRMGIDRLFGEDASMRDYGLKSSETSDEVHRFVYADRDLWKLGTVLNTGTTRMLVGHFPVMRYAGLFDANRIFSIVREPVQRVVSEYGHFVRNYGFKGSLMKFSRQATFVNKQADMLAGVPLEAIGLVGLMERYRDTMRLFEQSFGFRPTLLEENKGREDFCEPYVLSPEEENELRQLNRRDLALYQRARDIFDRRVAVAANSEPYVRGQITSIEGGVVRGWAVYDAGETPVVIEVLVDNEVIGSATAAEFRPRLKGLGVGRGGFVGFSFRLPAAKMKGKVQCCVQGTDAHLLNS
jgi:hypothetical protein